MLIQGFCCILKHKQASEYTMIQTTLINNNSVHYRILLWDEFIKLETDSYEEVIEQYLLETVCIT